MAPVQKPVNEDEIMGVPKWVWAAIAGGVITAGLAIYIFSGDSDAKKKKPKKKPAGKTPGTASTPKVTPKATPKATPKKAAAKVTVEDAPEEDDIDKVRIRIDLEYDFVYPLSIILPTLFSYLIILVPIFFHIFLWEF